ncbi:MAG TPA: SRPBCC family protein [Ferruginibacter sp.]|nr:SRPBCC family protein [Ferruginibacter sp.]
MPSIHLTTFVAAPIKRVFDLSRSIDLHQLSTAHTDEKAIDGVMKGLINENEMVTWEAKHLFRKRQFTSRIAAMQTPLHFIDEMEKGDFKSFRHEHHFKEVTNGTIMIDQVNFESPYGALGRWINSLYLKKYLEKLLINRNNVIKDYAETEKWKTILS